MKKFLVASLFLLVFNILAFSEGDIRRVDFNNFTYTTYCSSEENKEITVRNGEFFEENFFDGYSRLFYFKVYSATYGDLNGDGREEAAVLTVCSVGEEAALSEGIVFTMRNGKPSVLTHFEGGDRANNGLRSAKFEKGLLIVERHGTGEFGFANFPEFTNTTNYRWNGFELVQVGRESRKELYPATPVAIEKGKSHTDLTVSMKAGELKRYRVNASAAQTLIASSGSKDVYIRMTKGNCDVEENENGLVAHLNENGDYVIQIQNTTQKDTNAVIKIRVQ